MAHRIAGCPVTSPASDVRPLCVLLVGLPGSGKTTLSRTLEEHGFARLCPDEEMFRRHGVYGVDFPRGVFPTLERPILEETARELRKKLQSGISTVLDHGLWTPDVRAHWLSIASDANAITLLVYLQASHEELWSRISKRNSRHEADPNSIFFSENDLIRYRNRFSPPDSEEPHVVYDGDPESILKTLEESRR